MFSYPNSVRSHARGKTVEQIADDPRMAPFADSIAPLSNTVRNLTRRVKRATLGQGTFGRVNLETLSNGRSQVATKYFARTEELEQNLSEIVTLHYLKGYPNVAQYVGIASTNAEGNNLAFPALVMARAQSSLVQAHVNYFWPLLYQTILDILRGYFVLHSLGIAHRDTKPDNMLRTAYGETWVTDFGKSRYLTPYISLQDAYPGTIWYCSPEVLLASLVKQQRDQLRDASIPECSLDWYAHDCWAVGVSILEILTNVPIFAEQGRRETLKKMFQIKGTPGPEDGETFRLFQLFQKYYGEVRTVRKPFSFALSVLLDTSLHVDIMEGEQKALVTMLQGFLTYDPAKRWTARQALEFLGEDPAPIPRPLLYANRLIPNTSSSIERIVQTMYRLVSSPDDEGYSLSRKSRYIILDRACVYLVWFLANREVASESKEIVALSMSCLILASCLFNGYGHGFRLDFGKVFGISSDEIVEHLRMFLQMDLPFYGTTILDTLLDNVKPSSVLGQKQCGLLNLLCFQHMLYVSYRDRIAELVSVCGAMVRNPQSRLCTELSGPDYDHADLMFRKRAVLEGIVQDMRHGMGDRNANVSQALAQAEFAQLSNLGRNQYVRNFVNGAKSRRTTRRLRH
jgi:serine/threonine protein kinase